ncbi:MAG: hypothetical protein K2O15_07385 [Lachnospiraceae bacterium]|nr:hypothetical protein [Lachnospiraceae bacterium]
MLLSVQATHRLPLPSHLVFITDHYNLTINIYNILKRVNCFFIFYTENDYNIVYRGKFENEFSRSITAGLLTGKLRSGRLFYVLAAIGVCILPAGAVFLFPFGTFIRYAVIVAGFCGMQAAISIFSIFAVSIIRQNTPDGLIGKLPCPVN